jgi:hypothetical protein
MLKWNFYVIVAKLVSADYNDTRDISIQIYVSNLTAIACCVSFMDGNVKTDWIDITF